MWLVAITTDAAIRKGGRHRAPFRIRFLCKRSTPIRWLRIRRSRWRDRKDQFSVGLTALTQLTDGKVFLCKGEQTEIPGGGIDGVSVETFVGPHPAGLVGTHIHFLDPVGPQKRFGTSITRTFARSDRF